MLCVAAVWLNLGVALGRGIPWPYPNNGNNDKRLSQNVDVKYFNKLNRNLGETWCHGGHKISFTGSHLSLQDDSTFIPNIETIFISHGYQSSADTMGGRGCETFVQTYHAAGRNVQVICIDWRNLASLRLWDVMMNGGAYNGESQNSVDVGWWMGRLLHSLVEKTGLDSDNVHLIGHSLGAHVVGMMGRTFTSLSFTSLSGKQVARVTGLDPAGPLFVRDAYGLKKHMIGRDSAAFVDIIHTSGAFDPYAFNIFHMSSPIHMGALQALGHADFYPNGGMRQVSSGCAISAGICSHRRSIVYYLHSILDGPAAFQAYPCASDRTCSQGKKTSREVANHLGEFASKPKGGAQKQYYLDITTDYGLMQNTILSVYL